MTKLFSADEFGKAVEAAKQTSVQHAGCSIHLTATIRVHPIDSLRPPEISGYRISDWFDQAVVYTFVDGQALNP